MASLEGALLSSTPSKFQSTLIPIPLFMPIVIPIGRVLLMIDAQPPAFAFSLARILFFGVLRSRILCPARVQRPNIAAWRSLVLNYYGYNFSYKKLIHGWPHHSSYGVITWGPHSLLPTSYFMHALNT
jgi:hypothetical protein